MWQSILASLLIGLVFGSAVGAFNHWLVWSALQKTDELRPAQVKNKFMMRYLIRYAVDFLALGTYLLHRDTYVLVGTAVGLTLIGKILAVKYSFLKKEVK